MAHCCVVVYQLNQGKLGLKGRWCVSEESCLTMLDLNHVNSIMFCLRQILEVEVYIKALKGRRWKLSVNHNNY